MAGTLLRYSINVLNALSSISFYSHNVELNRRVSGRVEAVYSRNEFERLVININFIHFLFIVVIDEINTLNEEMPITVSGTAKVKHMIIAIRTV